MPKDFGRIVLGVPKDFGWKVLGATKDSGKGGLGKGEILMNIQKKPFSIGLQANNLLAIFVLLVVCLLVLEVPRQLVDILVVANLVFSITILFKALFSSGIQGIYSFPSMLVLTSLFRLALSVSLTKLILLYGDRGTDVAGEVVGSFGLYASGADPVVGAVLFLIVALVNLLVIAKGSLRVAEVSARFTLDSMPGKQLAIDSDFRSGMISVEEASKQRRDLNLESQFYGSIDGAMKWVQGDALASLVVAITCVTCGAGLGIYRGLSFEQAINTFGVLTVGAGLVSILPSLLMSVASGIIVSKVQGEINSSTGDDLVGHFFSDLNALKIAGIATGIFGLIALVGISSFPAWPFIIISGFMLAAANFYKEQNKVTYSILSFPSSEEKKLVLPDKNNFSVFKLEVDSEIANYLSLEEGRKSNLEKLHEYFQLISEEFYLNTGISFPKLEVIGSDLLSKSNYRVLVRENEVIRSFVNLNQLILDCSRTIATALGFKILDTTKHPYKLNQTVCVDKKHKGLMSLEPLGIKTYLPYQVLANATIAAILKVIEEVFGVDESKELVNGVRGSTDIVDEVFTNGKVSYPEYSELLRRLIREGVNIRDQKLILETVVEFLVLHIQSDDRQEWLADLHLHVRKGLSRLILKNCLAPGDKLRVFLLADEVESEFRSALRQWQGVRSLPPLSPELEPVLRESISRVVNPMFERGALPIVVLCAQDIRSAVQEFLLRYFAGGDVIKAVSFDEVGSKYNSEVIGLLGVVA